ncbi:Putative Dehydrogenase [Sodalis praecaptivus]|uniref:Putative Dehydrogenase n=1 Tax=Sodalis praecaptivus TaxID=1239307 RepID=W0HWX4_9GAMM|nr:Putative Dehydrogenase [Sodalis praecaptivus]
MLFDGRALPFHDGDTVASALLVAGIAVFRASPVSGAPRAPYCLMGICYDCLVNINGVDNLRACQVQARDGMVVSRQSGARADAALAPGSPS